MLPNHHCEEIISSGDLCVFTESTSFNQRTQKHFLWRHQLQQLIMRTITSLNNHTPRKQIAYRNKGMLLIGLPFTLCLQVNSGDYHTKKDTGSALADCEGFPRWTSAVIAVFCSCVMLVALVFISHCYVCDWVWAMKACFFRHCFLITELLSLSMLKGVPLFSIPFSYLQQHFPPCRRFLTSYCYKDITVTLLLAKS